MAKSPSIKKIRGMKAEWSAKFNEHQILNTEQLLKAGSTPEARRKLSKLVGVNPQDLLELLNRADLHRIGGIGEAYSNLLEEAWVDTVKELSKRVPANLLAKISEINSAKKITTRPPTLRQIEVWVTEAKRLPVLLEY